MLPKKYWANSSVIKSVRESKPSYSKRNKYLVVKYYPYSNILVSVVVPKKVVKKAVERNQIKRKIKSVLRKQTPSLKSGVYVIILLRPFDILNDEKIASYVHQVLPEDF